MPAQTVTQIITDVQLAFPDANAALVLDCVNRVHRDLCAEFPLIKVTTDVSLVAGTREYALDRDIMGIRVATYFPDASGAYQLLEPLDITELDRDNLGWRQWGTAVPKGFYIDAGSIGFFPTPSVSTDGGSGYPKVTYEATEASELAITDSIPTSIKSSRVYVQGARRYYAEYAAPDKVGLYEQLYEKEMNDVERTMGRRNRNFRQKVTPMNLAMASQI